MAAAPSPPTQGADRILRDGRRARMAPFLVQHGLVSRRSDKLRSVRADEIVAAPGLLAKIVRMARHELGKCRGPQTKCFMGCRDCPRLLAP